MSTKRIRRTRRTRTRTAKTRRIKSNRRTRRQNFRKRRVNNSKRRRRNLYKGGYPSEVLAALDMQERKRNECINKIKQRLLNLKVPNPVALLNSGASSAKITWNELEELRKQWQKC